MAAPEENAATAESPARAQSAATAQGAAAPQTLADPAARVLAQWAPVIDDLVAAGDAADPAAAEARQRMEPLMRELDQADEWRALVAVLRRILAGERDEAALVQGLDATDHLIVDAVLERLGGGEQGRAGEPGRPAQAQQVTLDELLALVARARAPEERDLNAQMYLSARRMAEAEAAPGWQRALGAALMAVLDGEPEPDLSALPGPVADKVRRIALGRGD